MAYSSGQTESIPYKKPTVTGLNFEINRIEFHIYSYGKIHIIAFVHVIF